MDPIGYVAIFLIIVIVIGVAAKADADNTKATSSKLGVKPDEVERVLGLNYLGGFPHCPTPTRQVELKATQGILALTRADKVLLNVGMDSVIGMQVESATDAKRRYTATRMLGLGIFALAAPKRTPGSALITIDTVDGPIILEKEKCEVPRALQIVSKPMALINEFATGRVSTDRASGGSTISDEITKLAEMHASGVLTDDEFSAAKRELLRGDPA